MAIWIVLPILTLLMFDLGLSLKFEDFGRVFQHPWPIAVALLGQLVLLPLIALGLAWAFRLPPVFFIGLVLIACCPGGITIRGLNAMEEAGFSNAVIKGLIIK